MPFFLHEKKKRKVDERKPKRNGLPKAKKSKVDDDEITSESEQESDVVERQEKESSSDESSSEDETPEEKRVRLANLVLAKKKAAMGEYGEDDDDYIGDQLKQENLERAGKLHREVADAYLPPTESDVTWCLWCKLDIVTSVTVTPDCSSVFCGCKDGTIVKWNCTTGEKLHVIHGRRKKNNQHSVGHDRDVLCLAISSDGKFLVSGGKDMTINVWNPANCQLIHKLTGHRSPVIGLAFRIGTHELFSCSERISNSAAAKVWNLDEMGFIDTLLAPDLSSIDCLYRDHPVAAGGQESNIILWKLDTDKSVLFSGRREESKVKSHSNVSSNVHRGSIDCVRYINDQHIISGASDNSLALWNVNKSRFPIATVINAHEGGGSTEHWITSLATIHYSDFMASGSNDGFIRFWKSGKNFQSLLPRFSCPVDGFINGLEFSSDGKFIVAGIGQQHSRGRWFKPIKISPNLMNRKPVKNCVCIIRLTKTVSNS